MFSKQLKRDIENVFGSEIRYPKDCDTLATDISKKTRTTISGSTVRRLFGFVKTNSKPSTYTLDCLAKYLGFETWKQYEQSKPNEQILAGAKIEQDYSVSTCATIDQKKRGLSRRIIKYLTILFLFVITVGLVGFFYPHDVRKTLVVKALAVMPESRNGGKAMADHQFIYYLGGTNNSFTQNNLWRYDTNKNEWKNLSPMLTARGECAAAMLNGRIYAFGGWLNNSDGMTDAAEIYDVSKNEWDTLPRLPVKITSANAIATGDDIYVLGGTIGETTVYFFRFNTLSRTYESLPTFAPAMMYCSMVLVDNNIYAIGGNSYVMGKYQWHNDVFAYDLLQKKWSAKSKIPVPITESSAVEHERKIHLFGGVAYRDNSTIIENTHFIYDIKKDKWESGNLLPTPLCMHQAATCGESVYLVGGMKALPNPIDDVVKIDF